MAPPRPPILSLPRPPYRLQPALMASLLPDRPAALRLAALACVLLLAHTCAACTVGNSLAKHKFAVLFTGTKPAKPAKNDSYGKVGQRRQLLCLQPGVKSYNTLSTVEPACASQKHALPNAAAAPAAITTARCGAALQSSHLLTRMLHSRPAPSSIPTQSAVEQHFQALELDEFRPVTASTFSCVDSRSEHNILVRACGIHKGPRCCVLLLHYCASSMAACQHACLCVLHMPNPYTHSNPPLPLSPPSARAGYTRG